MSLANNIMFSYMVLISGLIIIAICSFVIFVKLALRGIKALDIYIEKNNKNNDY